MSFDFPASPVPGQAYQPPGGPGYVFDGERWKGGSAPATPVNEIAEDAFWATRAAFVADVAGGFPIYPGKVYTAGGYDYIGTPGATAIPDLPDLLPLGDVHVEHFGAVADLLWDIREVGVYTGSSGTTGSRGPYYISGTDNFAIIQLVNDYVTDAGIGEFYMEGGDYYSVGQVALSSRIKSRNNFANTLWLRYALDQVGMLVQADNAGVEGLQVVAQYFLSAGQTKPPNRGELGCAITINLPFVPVGQHRIRRNLKFDVRFCRAGYEITGTGQRSAGSILMFGGAGIENSHFRLGVFGETNISSNAILVCHWGAEYSEGSPDAGYGTMVITESFHFCDSTVEIVGDIDQIATPHGLLNVAAFTGAGTFEVSDINCRGVANPLFIFPGDSCGFYATESQRGKVMKGIRIGYVNGRDCPTDTDAVPPSMRGGGDAILLNGCGTMAAFTFDRYDDTAQPITRQIEVDIRCKGFSLTRGVYPPIWGGRGIFVDKLLGHVDLGVVTTYGWGRGLDIEHCHGTQIASYIEGDGSIYLASNRGTRILDSRIDKGNALGNVADGVFSLGYAAGNKCVYAAGTAVVVTTTTADSAAGETKTMIAPLAVDVGIGEPIKIGPHWVTCTDFMAQPVPYLLHTPLPAAVASGAVVNVDYTNRVSELALSSSSGQIGLDVIYTSIDRLDLTRLGWAGQRAVQLRNNSRATIVGLVPPTVGRMDPVSGNNTIHVDASSQATLVGVSIPVNARVNAAFGLVAGVGGGGSVHLTKCRIEDVATLIDPAMALADKVRQLSMAECVDFTGDIIAHPWRKGGADAAGFYQCYEDGSLIQWLRNKLTDASGNYTWTFPMAFAAVGPLVVVASPTSQANPGFVQPAGAAGLTSTTLKAWNSSGAAAAIAFNAVATGRWF